MAPLHECAAKAGFYTLMKGHRDGCGVIDLFQLFMRSQSQSSMTGKCVRRSCMLVEPVW